MTMQSDVKLLDCTLRDGGYVNDWNWGYRTAKQIIQSLVDATVDFVEVGFLRNVGGYNPDVTVCNRIEDLNRLLPENTGSSSFSAMAMRSNYDIKKLSPYSGKGIEMIRITAHEYDIEDGMDFAREVKDKGYKLSINPINIMGYTDKQILWILEQVNAIHPYQFSIVDTFGSMRRRDLDRIASMVDNNLDRDIRVGLHLHENMASSCLLAQNFIDKHLRRPIAVDGSLMGMGRIPGNLPIELIADYLNDNGYKAYDIDSMLDAIQDHIAPIKGNAQWGYTPAYFLSAKFNLHRNYAEHYLSKGDITHRDINRILSNFDPQKAAVFDAAYADSLYEDYKSRIVDDKESREQLAKSLAGKKILVIAPGSSIVKEENRINDFIKAEKPVVISVNFNPDNYSSDYVFFSSSRRFAKFIPCHSPVIATSNIDSESVKFQIGYNSISKSFKQGSNSLIMLLNLLKQLDVHSISIAGADGYSETEMNYYDKSMRSPNPLGNQYNLMVAEAIRLLDLDLNFVTPSAYEVKY